MDYGVPLTIYGDCTSYNGRIRENVGLERMLDYRDVGLERFHCICCS